MIKVFSLIIFLSGYLAISQEHILQVSKTSISLIIAVLLWFLVVVSFPGNLTEVFQHTGGEVFNLIIYLLSAMTLVEILTHYGLFDMIYLWLNGLKFKDKAQFFIINLLAFIFSIFINNMTTTIVLIQISRRFFQEKIY